MFFNYFKDLCKITQSQPGQQRYTLVISQVTRVFLQPFFYYFFLKKQFKVHSFSCYIVWKGVYHFLHVNTNFCLYSLIFEKVCYSIKKIVNFSFSKRLRVFSTNRFHLKKIVNPYKFKQEVVIVLISKLFLPVLVLFFF